MATLRERVGGSLFTRVSDFFDGMFERLLENVTADKPGIVEGVASKTQKILSDEMPPELKQTIQTLLENSVDPEILNSEAFKQFKGTPALLGLIGGAVAMATLIGEAMTAVQIIAEPVNQKIREKFKPFIPDPSTVITAGIKFPDKEIDIKGLLERLGFDEDMQDIIKKSIVPLIPIEVIRTLTLRKDVEGEDLSDELKKYGYTEEMITKIKKSWEVIPGVSDIITMAVREVFSPEIAAAFGQFEGYPEELSKWAKAAGLSEEWAKNFWAAHWSLPSPLQGFEMLHRGIIDEATLSMLLRALDIMPFWRDKVMQISYNPYTRVDVRRMFALGVIDEAEVKKTYKDLGYDEEHATNLTEFVKKYTTEAEKDATKSEVINAFIRNIITLDQTTSYLKNMGYNSDSIDIIIGKAVYDKEKKTKTLNLTRIRKRYLNGLINESEAIRQLDILNVTASERDLLIQEWILDKQGDEPILSLKTLQTLLMKKIIDKTQFRQELSNKGYGEVKINWLMQLTSKNQLAE